MHVTGPRTPSWKQQAPVGIHGFGLHVVLGPNHVPFTAAQFACVVIEHVVIVVPGMV